MSSKPFLPFQAGKENGYLVCNGDILLLATGPWIDNQGECTRMHLMGLEPMTTYDGGHEHYH
jgi:hypothetical protein